LIFLYEKKETELEDIVEARERLVIHFFNLVVVFSRGKERYGHYLHAELEVKGEGNRGYGRI
jgi:hypothetical protein